VSKGLDVIIIDDEPVVCEVLSSIIKRFYAWGEVIAFSDANKATSYCLSRDIGGAVFVVDVFLDGKSGFCFLDGIAEKFPTAYEDTIVITGRPSDDVVNMCVASNVHYLLEKPIKAYALQLAVMSVVSKYLRFAKILLSDPVFAESVSRLS
jgi:response regulator of citrate/malate metabolism